VTGPDLWSWPVLSANGGRSQTGQAAQRGRRAGRHRPRRPRGPSWTPASAVLTGWGRRTASATGPDGLSLDSGPGSHLLAQPQGASPFAFLGLSDLISRMGTVARRKQPSLYLVKTWCVCRPGAGQSWGRWAHLTVLTAFLEHPSSPSLFLEQTESPEAGWESGEPGTGGVQSRGTFQGPLSGADGCCSLECPQ